MENKLREWRPEECHTRIGDEVEVMGVRFLKVKCRRCTRREGQDVFHYLELGAQKSV